MLSSNWTSSKQQTLINIGQFSKPGTDLESEGPDVFKTTPTCPNWPSFGWDIWG